MKKEHFIFGLKIFVFGAFALFSFGFITMLLWNWLMPEIFNLPQICWFQAMGLIVLSKILFSGFGKGKQNCNSGIKNKIKSQLGWKEKIKNRYSCMNDEEKEKFKNKCSSWFDSEDNC